MIDCLYTTMNDEVCTTPETESRAEADEGQQASGLNSSCAPFYIPTWAIRSCQAAALPLQIISISIPSSTCRLLPPPPLPPSHSPRILNSHVSPSASPVCLSGPGVPDQHCHRVSFLHRHRYCIQQVARDPALHAPTQLVSAN